MTLTETWKSKRAGIFLSLDDFLSRTCSQLAVFIPPFSNDVI